MSPKLSSNFNDQPFLDRELLVYKIIKHELRTRIFLLLFLYPELNVSEIARKLNASKATVSRHLIEMQKDGVLEHRKEKTQGIPKYYRLPTEKLKKFLPTEQQVPLDAAGRVDFYKNAIGTIQSLVLLVQNAFNLIHPIIKQLDTKITDIDSADDAFAPFFYPNKKLDFSTVVMSEKLLPKFHELNTEFRKKIIKLAEEEEVQGEEKTIIYFESLLPLRTLLEYENLMDEDGESDSD